MTTRRVISLRLRKMRTLPMTRKRKLQQEFASFACPYIIRVGCRSKAVVLSGGYEELDDNFVLQALGEEEVPEWPEGTVAESAAGPQGTGAADFDFDAHIAKLMARAEGKWTD